MGQWTVVRDPTAAAGAAIEHRSGDPQEDRFPLAIFRPLSTENVDFAARVKIISGTLLSAGIAVGVRSPQNYYAIVLSALERRVDVLLIRDGKVERLESAEAEIARERWHELRVLVNDDHFTVTVDGQKLITTYDRSRRKDGRVALWTQEDNVTRFDRITVQALPDTDYR
jgi:3-keto-disaccharide hydrolase